MMAERLQLKGRIYNFKDSVKGIIQGNSDQFICFDKFIKGPNSLETIKNIIKSDSKIIDTYLNFKIDKI